MAESPRAFWLPCSHVIYHDGPSCLLLCSRLTGLFDFSEISQIQSQLRSFMFRIVGLFPSKRIERLFIKSDRLTILRSTLQRTQVSAKGQGELRWMCGLGDLHISRGEAPPITEGSQGCGEKGKWAHGWGCQGGRPKVQEF